MGSLQKALQLHTKLQQLFPEEKEKKNCVIVQDANKLPTFAME